MVIKTSCSNPHPVRKLGAMQGAGKTTFIEHVPILTQSENWALSQGADMSWLTWRSNPHPVRKLGAIRKSLNLLTLPMWFQSSPSPKTGRYACNCCFFAFSATFQSSPSPKTGRYIGADLLTTSKILVPILTQSENWALSLISSTTSVTEGVPILTQSENWALSVVLGLP